MRDGTVVIFGGFGDDARPVGKAAVRREGGVVGVEARVEFLEFEVAARFSVSNDCRIVSVAGFLGEWS